MDTCQGLYIQILPMETCASLYMCNVILRLRKFTDSQIIVMVCIGRHCLLISGQQCARDYVNTLSYNAYNYGRLLMNAEDSVYILMHGVTLPPCGHTI